MKRLLGKNIVITGGTSGIGKATAIKLAENGASVIISGRNNEKAKVVIDEISTHGTVTKFFKCEITNKNEIENLLNFAVKALGSIDCLFNNAGTDGEVAFLAESTEKNWDDVMNTNLKS